MTEESSPSPSYVWKCACGAYQVKLKAPPVFEMNCHCHSCVAPARYLDTKYPTTSKSGLVANNGGVGKTFFQLKDIELPKENGEGLSFFKVGNTGENIRSYTTCCGTLFNTAGGKCFPKAARPITRNNIFQKNTDVDGSSGTTPFVSPESPTNVITEHAFHDYTLPDPHFKGYSPQAGAGFSKLDPIPEDEEISKFDSSWFKVGSDVKEVVPITW